jgi:hypothetical protein
MVGILILNNSFNLSVFTASIPTFSPSEKTVEKKYKSVHGLGRVCSAWGSGSLSAIAAPPALFFSGKEFPSRLRPLASLLFSGLFVVRNAFVPCCNGK